MNPPSKRIPVIIPVGVILAVLIAILITACKITDLKLDVKEITVPSRVPVDPVVKDRISL